MKKESAQSDIPVKRKIPKSNLAGWGVVFHENHLVLAQKSYFGPYQRNLGVNLQLFFLTRPYYKWDGWVGLEMSVWGDYKSIALRC